MAVLSVEERGKQSLKKYQDEVDIGNLNGTFESAYGFKNQRKAFLNFTNILFVFILEETIISAVIFHAIL